MNSRNGISKTFRFIIDDTIKLNFSFKYKALDEWTQEKWIFNTVIDGVVKQKFLYFHTFFKIDWSQLIIGTDSDKLQQLRNAEFAGSKIELMPHIDLPRRYFDVVTLKSKSGDSEQINLSQIINRRRSPGNQGTVMIFQTRWPQYFWDIRDPSNQKGVAFKKLQRING